MNKTNKCSTGYNTQYNGQSVYLSKSSFQGKVARIIRDTTMHSKDILRKAKGDHLDRVHSDQIVLQTIRWGRLILCTGG